MKYLKDAMEMAGEIGEKADEAVSRLRWGWVGKIVAVILWYILTGWIEGLIISAVLFLARATDPSLQLYYGVQQPLRWCLCCGLRLPLFLIPLFLYFRWKRKQGNATPPDTQDGE
jgi:hypothetical protein